MKKLHSQGVSTVLILGVIAVLVTIIVPLISRTVVDIRITKQQEEQARAFSIAETGLEKAMITDFGDEGLIRDTVDGIDYTVTKWGRGDSVAFIYPKPVERDFPVTVWLMEHQGADFDSEAALDPNDRYQAGKINLYWGEPGTSAIDDQTPALQVTLFYQDSTDNYKVEKHPLDPYTGVASERIGNNFESAESAGPYTVGSEEFQFRALNVPVSCSGNNLCYALRIKLLYNDDLAHPIAIEGIGNNLLPRQGECFQSVATVQTSGVTSRVERCVFYKDFPSIFDFVLYSYSEDFNLEKLIP